tara:strand:- start:638 stop:3538 length:2901 start_codon:yes stop_codon:yes gene_type:complete
MHACAMSVERRTQSGLLVTLLLLTALAPLTMVQAQPTSPSEFYYGVEYDWQSLDDDFSNISGLHIDELLTEIMEDADSAGFNLDLGQLTTGSTNVYVHQTEDITMQTIQDGNGDDVQVWSRTSDVVLRHGVLFDGVLLTDWNEAASFGGDPTSIDIDVITQFENVLTVDILYTEYLTDEYKLIGADMDIDMTVGADMSLDVDIALEGGGEELAVDFATGINFGYSMESTDAVWRLGSQSPIYIEASENEETHWECTDYEEDVGIWDEWSEAEVYDLCGDVLGTYTGSADYEIYFTGLPTEEFGLDSGEFDLTVSDAFTQSGNYDGEFNGGADFRMETDMEGEDFEVSLGNGETVDAVACVDCPPGNPIMFMMMGNVLGHASIAFGEEIADDLEASFEDSIVDTFLNEWANNLAEGNSGDDWDPYENQWQCDSGQWVYEWYVNDGNEDCYDGSDEMTMGTNYQSYEDWNSGDQVHKISGTVYADDLSFTDRMFTCDDSTEIHWQEVNDGANDCSGGEDEQNQDSDRMFTCGDGTEIAWDWINDGNPNCGDGSDERNTNEIYHIEAILLDGSMPNANILYHNDTMTICGGGYSWAGACDIAPEGDDERSYFEYGRDDMNDPNLNFGDNVLCTTGNIMLNGNSVYEQPMMCDNMWMGPQIDWMDVYSDGMTLNYDARVSHYDATDAESDVEIVVRLVPEDGQQVIQSKTFPLDETNSHTFVEDSFDVSNEGDYCVIVALVAPGETEDYSQRDRCEEVSTEGDPSDRIVTIAEAIADSGLQNVMENFAENLEETFQDVSENEVPEFPYTDGMWAPLWSTEHATIIGVGLYAMDEDGDKYVIAGPETTGYSENLPMTFMSIRYLTGASAQSAQTTMADFEDLNDIVDIEDHDLTALEDALEQAGVDTSTLNLGDDGTTDGGADGGTTDEPDTAVEVAEDGGLLPFLSPLSVLAMVGIAAFAGKTNRREDNE